MLAIVNKQCKKCGVVKPVTDYHAHPKLQYHPRCKPCRAEGQREYYRANPDKFKAYKAQARGETLEERAARIQKRKDEAPAKRKATQWRSHIKRTLGISADEYTQMLEAQDHSCAICGTQEPGRGYKNFSIDHCHDTGKIRGLLCNACNVGLGYFKDNEVNLEAAIKYLRKAR